MAAPATHVLFRVSVGFSADVTKHSDECNRKFYLEVLFLGENSLAVRALEVRIHRPLVVYVCHRLVFLTLMELMQNVGSRNVR